MSKTTTRTEYRIEVRRVGARSWVQWRSVGSDCDGALTLLRRERDRMTRQDSAEDYVLRLVSRTVTTTASAWVEVSR